ncbi:MULTISPECIES: VWA domain-containing protein [Roseivirga]|jgi:Ca-activated chloride channel family protein|uniref:Aerotolerance regulator BatB n=1 Tax=Roseivirga spongicola TaxID=333140 RepID=A0A150XBT1_9BACT|nr:MULTISPECIES: VWA domain-containing protein [Roseivirga]PWL28381.1 MAG: VWA domain-containing protein [Roseivirga sp. XM-24bin3]KYG76140.1 aerotolerance regulator BatB [Roseivirga spongicola]MBO6659333.1 VWA domain-containing protein [Roseivirga sp.]MBO6760947.1 VWA domain-containing protein [Roseivirga sp.]MBO6907930.1 VWA domain-containing protein [Roseivirga sp.]
MTWFKSIGTTELVIIGVFLVAYAIYISRLLVVAKRMNTTFRPLIFKILIRSLALAFLIVALLGPSFGETTKEVKSEGKDIYIAVDLSQSMNAFDIQPTRLEKIKFELKNIVEAFSSDRIGLIIFSSEAFVQCPLTYDQSALSLFISTLNTSLVPNAGTDFGAPLSMAFDKLDETESPITQQKAKIVLMISDGEDFGDETQEAAEQIVKSGIQLFALGVGTETGSKIRQANGFKRDREGQEVVTKLNSKSLRKLAVDTGGKYFEINENQNDVERLIRAINEVEGEVRDARTIDASANKFYFFLLGAIVLLALDALIRRKTLRI